MAGIFSISGYLTRAFILVFLTCQFYQIHSQVYYPDHFSLNEGVPSISISALEEDSRSYLWIGTPEKGICRFDGRTFEVFPDQFRNEYIYCIYENPEDALIYVGTESGLHRFNGWEFVHLWGGHPVLSINSFNGQLLFATQNSLLTLKDKSVVPFIDNSNFKSKSINCLMSSEELLMIGTSQGIIRLTADNKNAENFSINISFPEENILSMTVFNAYLYAGSVAGKLIRQKLKNPDDHKIRGMGMGSIQGLSVFENHALIAASKASGLQIIHPEDFNIAYPFDEVSLNNGYAINCFLGSSKGSFWIGTEKSGLLKYSKRDYNYFGREEGIKGKEVYALCVSENKTFVSTQNGIIDIIEYGAVSDNPLKLPNTNTKTTQLFKDSKERLWIGSDGDGLILKDSSAFKFPDKRNQSDNNIIRAITEDQFGNIWVSSNTGISIIRSKTHDKSEFTIDPLWENNHFGGRKINDLEIDQEKTLWVATQGGLYSIAYDSSYQQQNLLKYPGTKAIEEIKIGQDGKVYFITQNEFGRIGPQAAIEILYQFKGSSLKAMEQVDPQNWILGGNYGIYLIDLHDPGAIEPAIYHPDPPHSPFEIRSSTIKASEQKIWLGGQNGLLVLRKKNLSKETTSRTHKLIFKEISIDYQNIFESEHKNQVDHNLNFKKGIRFKPTLKHIGFSFNAVDLESYGTYLYRWKLKGLDKSWTPWTTMNEINYSNLKAGTYRFHVQSRRSNYINEIETGEFIIEEVIWKKSAFIATLSLLFFAILVLIVFLRFKMINRKNQRKIDHLNIENELLQLEQKAAQLQMNPHFLNNALNAIQGLIITEKKGEARNFLGSFSILMEKVLMHSRSDLVLLSEEIELIQNYLEIEKLIRDNSFEFEIQRSTYLQTKAFKIAPMILQPLVENAVVHGIRSADNKGKISIQFKEISAVKILCRITDNGKGLEFNQQNKLKKSRKSVSSSIVRARLDILHGKKGNWLTIKDIVDNEGKILGVEVNLILPTEI